MTTTRETEVIIGDAEVVKTALHPRAFKRLTHEALCLGGYMESPHLPNPMSYVPATHALTMERINGQSFKDVFGIDSEWHGTPMAWPDAAHYLEQYVTAETDLLSRGLMYRDLNLDHLIFTGDKAVLVDHEETVGENTGRGLWWYRSVRGTWETMAPEEFPGYGYLTERTATYRTGVLAHLALSGSLPFPRFPLRHDVQAWRRRHAAKIDETLPKPTRRALRTALQSNPEQRQLHPEVLLEQLAVSYEEAA